MLRLTVNECVALIHFQAFSILQPMDFRCRNSSWFALHHSRMTDFNDTCLRTLCDNWKTWWCLIDCKEKYSNIKHYLDDCGFYLFVYLQHSNTKQSSQFDQHCNLFNKISLLWLRMNNKRWRMKRKHLCTHQCNCINCLNIKWAYRFLFICRVLGVLYTRISQPVLSIFFIWFCFVLFCPHSFAIFHSLLKHILLKRAPPHHI